MSKGASYTKSSQDGRVLYINPTATKPPKIFHGGGGGSGVDSETKNYVDKSMESVKAQNDARFAEVIAKLDAMHPATWQQNAAVAITSVVVALGLVFAVLAYASDRFDSGVGSMGAVNDALNEQREINDAQGARLDKIIEALEKQNEQPQRSPSEGQD